MSNTLKTLSDGDIARKALSVLHNELIFIKSISRQYDDSFAKTGAKNGGQILIREPNEFTVRSGWTMNSQDVTESTQTYAISTVRGVDFEFSTSELTLSIDKFTERYLQPAMSRLAAEIEAVTIANCYKQVANVENTTFGTKPVLADVLAARAILNQGLAPKGNRTLMTESLSSNSIITAGYQIYNPASEISKQYTQGLMGSIYGFEHKESEMTPVHTSGTRTTAGTCDLSAITNGTRTLSITGTNTETYLEGDVITLAGVYDVNPETKTPLATLKPIAVASDYTSTGSAANMTIQFPIYKDGAKQNAYCANWAASSVATVVDEAGSNGSASTNLINNLAFHRDAFVFATADLEMPKGVDMSQRVVMDGISMSMVRDFDIVNRKFPIRFDVLFTSKCVRPRWACRVLA